MLRFQAGTTDFPAWDFLMTFWTLDDAIAMH